MNLHVVHAGYFRLDGGAMFGVVPKSIWQKTNPADENNLCPIAMRCLLIEDGDRLILIDTGLIYILIMWEAPFVIRTGKNNKPKPLSPMRSTGLTSRTGNGLLNPTPVKRQVFLKKIFCLSGKADNSGSWILINRRLFLNLIYSTPMAIRTSR